MGKQWKGTTEDEMAGWHYGLNGHECEEAPEVGDGQGSLACCSPWGHKESTQLSDWTDWVTLLCSLIPSLQVITEHQTGLPLLHSNFPAASHPTPNRVYMLMLPSPYVLPSLSLTVSTNVSMPSLQMGSSIPFSSFHIYVLIYYICFSHSNVLQSV